MIHISISGPNAEATQKTLKDLDAAMNGNLKDLCNVKGLESISIYPNVPADTCIPAVAPNAKTPAQGGESQPKAEPDREQDEQPEQPKDEKTYELVDVRAAANAYKDKHGIEKLREIFKKYGGEKLKDIPAWNYAALMEEIA